MTLPGYVDNFTVDLLTGWAWDPDRPDQPVEVAVLQEGRAVLKIKADRYRADLAEAGIGNGRHAFSLEHLHAMVPWSRRNLSTVRAKDGAVLSSNARSLIATGSPHLYLMRGGGPPFVAFGDRLYRLPSDRCVADMAAWLPMTLPEETDDPLPVTGAARWVESDPMPQLLLEPNDGPAVSIPVDEYAIAGAHVRICRGRTQGSGRLQDEVAIEVENAIGIELQCLLPGTDDLADRRLRVCGAGGQEQAFDLPPGRRTTIQIGVTQLARHRMHLRLDPHPQHNSGFLLCGLDVIAREPAFFAF
ncbi:MAG: hypothetical protein WDN25_03290 [Acetobacteraceae bacterium]